MINIAIVRLSSLGDIVQSCIILQFIKKNFKDSRISWIVDEKFAPVMKSATYVDEIISIPLKERNFIQSYEILKKYRNKFDIIIDPQGLIKSALVSRILGSNCIGFSKGSAKEPLASIFYKKQLQISYNENIIIRNLSLAAMALDFTYDLKDILNKKKIFKSKNEEFSFLKKNKFANILIAPFSSDESKNYASFYDVINGMKANFYILSLGDEQRRRAQNFAGENGIVLGDLNISQIINLIEKMDLVIGNDSGITHLAWAQNRPSITIFGNRPAKRNAFVSKINLVISSKKDDIDAKKIDKNDYCINKIDPKEIIKTAMKLLK